MWVIEASKLVSVRKWYSFGLKAMKAVISN